MYAKFGINIITSVLPQAVGEQKACGPTFTAFWKARVRIHLYHLGVVGQDMLS